MAEEVVQGAVIRALDLSPWLCDRSIKWPGGSLNSNYRRPSSVTYLDPSCGPEAWLPLQGLSE